MKRVASSGEATLESNAEAADRLPSEAAAMPRTARAFLWHYVKRRPVQFAALLLLLSTAAACAVGVQYGMKLIVDAMALEGRNSQAIWQFLGIFIGLIALESVLWRLGGWLGCHTVVSTGVDIRLDLFKHLAGHSMRYFSEHLSGALGGRITATAGAAGGIFGTFAWHILPPCIDFLGAVIVLLTIDVRMAFALVAFVAVVAVLVTRFGARGRPLHQAFAEQASRVNGELVDVVANVWAVKAFSARGREHARLASAFGIEARAQRRSWMHLEKARVLHDVCLWLMAGGMLAWAIHSWRQGSSSPGDVVVISALTFRILHGSRDLALAIVDATQQLGVIAEMLRVVATPHRVADAPGAPPFVPRGGALQFRAISFGYDAERKVLDRFELDVPAGQRLGVVGPSGAGKSTLLALIQRLDDVQAGEITIDAQPITQVQQDSLREAIAVVPQDIALLHRSVRDNIGYAHPEASLEQVVAAARAAHCHEFIEQLPQGYDTLVGERGIRLSGGQRQRLGIARAFLKDAQILLLDEATSSLDSASEVEIENALQRLMQGRTVISVAHRLSTVAHCDRVITLVDGRIVQDGPPRVLQQTEGLYRHLWKLQSEGHETP